MSVPIKTDKFNLMLENVIMKLFDFSAISCENFDSVKFLVIYGMIEAMLCYIYSNMKEKIVFVVASLS